MLRSWPAVSLLALLLCLLADGPVHTLDGPDDEQIVFLVSSRDLPMLEGVRVYLVSSKGEELVGRTDALGSLRIPRSLLKRDDAFSLLFCAEHFFCGAWRLTEPSFFRFKEHYIELAPVALR